MKNRFFYFAKYILLYFICLYKYDSFAQESINFIHINAQVERQQTNVTNVIEDSLGYIWLESDAGLLRFDGYDYIKIPLDKIFDKNAGSTSLLGLKKDREGSIWAISRNGDISKWTSSGKFKMYFSSSKLKTKLKLTSFHISASAFWLGSNSGQLVKISKDKASIAIYDINAKNEAITSITLEGKQNLWISTNKGRIFKASTSSIEFVELTGPFSNPFNTIYLTTDKKNENLWIATEVNGLYCYNLTNKTFDQFHNKANPSHFIPSNMIIKIFLDKKGMIWAGTDGGGLYQINPKSKKLRIYNHSKNNPFSLQTNTVIGIGETNDNNIWVFTNYGNINILPKESSTFGYHSGSLSGSPSRVLSILHCQNKDTWIGTDGEGITIIDQSGNASKQYIAKTKLANGLNGNYIQAIIEDEKQNKWIGTYLNGLFHYSEQAGNFSAVKMTNKNGQVATDIRSLYIDKKNRIWAGSNIGITVFSPKGQQLAIFSHNTKGLSGNIAEIFIEDEMGQLWIGMDRGGICLFTEAEKLANSKFTTYKLSELKDESKNSVLNATSDYAGNLYLINSNSELIKFNIKSKKTKPIKGFNKEELQSVTAVLLADSSNLWVSRTNGISHLDLKDSKADYYTWKNGTLKNTYLSGSAAKTKDGIMYFGGVGGLTYFNPSLMKTSPKKLNLYINKIEIVNQDAEQIIPQQLVEGIEHLKSLQLNHKQTSFSFQFSVVNDHLAPNYFYSYRLKGFDENWINTEKTRIASYTNIPYGDYTFEVRAGTKTNKWDIGLQKIQVKIQSPLWLRWWSYAIYILFFFSISFFILRYYLMWARLKKKLLVEELQNEKNKELYAMKMNFFVKMSHEIQTPLTLILSPIENMMERAEDNLLLKQRLQVIKNNANRLSRIALELMTVRNKELGKLKIKASLHNICKDIEKTALSFTEQARFKNIDFTLEGTNSSEIMLWYDQEKLEHILYNLLANAFKFTSREGKIKIIIKEDKTQDKLIIKIIDTGIGIPEADLKNIFKLFYQSKDGKMIGGTGIGLALTKELINLHKGTIEAASEINKGTSFTICLPKGKNHFTDEEIKLKQIDSQSKTIDIDLKDKQKDRTNQIPTSSALPKEDLKNISKTENKADEKKLLIVEDNFEMLLFLKTSFANNYDVCVAQNGQEAIDCLANFKADIILSDVMMPIMDGISLCKKLKEKQSTRHIPIILLTTKNTTNSKLEGLKYGAIEYINKPFNVKELLFKVNNILEAKKQIIAQYRSEILTDTKEIEVESPDEKFIEAVLLEIENNFQDPEFRLEELAEALHMSYSNIYRKFQSLTGKTLVDFVRSFRLQKAISLLINYNFTIAEIAFRVGFNDPKYFSKCFKKEYEKTPKQYKQEHDKNKI